MGKFQWLAAKNTTGIRKKKVSAKVFDELFQRNQLITDQEHVNRPFKSEILFRVGKFSYCLRILFWKTTFYNYFYFFFNLFWTSFYMARSDLRKFIKDLKKYSYKASANFILSCCPTPREQKICTVDCKLLLLWLWTSFECWDFKKS